MTLTVRGGGTVELNTLSAGSFHADSLRASQVTISDFYEIFSTGTSTYMMNTCKIFCS